MNLQITIDTQLFILPDQEPDYDRLPDTQAVTLRLLIALAHTNQPITRTLLVALLGLKSTLPLDSRLRHLEAKRLLAPMRERAIA